MNERCGRFDPTMPDVYPNKDAAILPGWGCCRCATYQGYQYDVCKRCGHEACFERSEGEPLTIGQLVARGQGDCPTADPRYDVKFSTIPARAPSTVTRLEELAEAYRKSWEEEREAEGAIWENDDNDKTFALAIKHREAEARMNEAHFALMKYIRRRPAPAGVEKKEGE